MGGLRKAALVGGCAAVLASAGLASALEMRPVLTLDVARKIVDGCLAKAQQQGWKMHIAVLDIGGNLKAFVRMDDAQPISEEVAMRKAYTAAALPRSTRENGGSRLQQSGASAGWNCVPAARRRHSRRASDHDWRGGAYRRASGSAVRARRMTRPAPRPASMRSKMI